MALARVQATGKVTADSAASVAITFASPPTVGNGLVVLLSLYSFSGAPTACVDNRSNSYSLAKDQAGSGFSRVAIYYCAAITGTGTPFTITVSDASTYFTASAVEISGVGSGLVLDKTAGAFSTGTVPNPDTGVTAALTGAEALLVGVCAMVSSEASITVVAASPTWTQEHEELSNAHAPGEGDTRIVTGALGSTPSCSWTMPTAAAWAAAIAAFKGPAAPAAVETVQSYVWGPA